LKGPAFFSLHELFDKATEELEGYTDEIAERALALGGVALGTMRIAANCSRLSEYPHDISSGGEHVEALSNNLTAFGKLVRAAIDVSSKAGDADSSDLFTGVRAARTNCCGLSRPTCKEIDEAYGKSSSYMSPRQVAVSAN
jgi:starvation-inducible DNA-binding protein